jgi:hypothetical protein
MPKTKRSLDSDAALKLFRQHLARTDEILTDHAQRAMSEARGNAKRAAIIMIPRMKADAALQVEFKALERLRSYAFPPMEEKQWRPWGNPNRRKRKSQKRRNRKSRKSYAQKA